ncbi:AAA family ATPase [Dehalogenimonas etheniformans]|nr:ATP-binding protein [Dehalogenimonas etheniformans]QNT76400.1 ATP-binding protein [Dehalogenimonas etheniformans]
MRDAALLAKDVARLRKAVSSKHARQTEHPVFVVLVGLPGSGKSYFASRLIEKIPAIVLESDFLRKNLVRKPVYTQFESFRLFRAIHELIRELLAAKYAVVLDATNLSADSRRPLAEIANETNAKIVLVHLNTPREVAEERLIGRTFKRDGYSDADWAVYQKLETAFEPIQGPHYEITGPMDISPVIDKIVAEIKKD